MFVGKTDTKTETLILWPSDMKNNSLEKTLMLGKIKGRRRRGRWRMRWLVGITISMDMSLCKLRELVMDREAWHAAVPWAARRSNQFILKEISPEYSLEGWMLKLKLQYFGHLMWRTDSLEKTHWERLKAGEEGDHRGWNGWHHGLNEHEFE